MGKVGIYTTSNPNQDVNSFFETEVQLMQVEKNKAGDAFNKFRTTIVKELEERTAWGWKYLNAGSHYDGTKEWLEVVHDDAPPEFCYIRLKTLTGATEDIENEDYQELKDLCEGGFLNSVKYRDKIFHIFEEGMKRHRHARADPDAKPDCPSFMVLLDVIPRADRKGLRTISLDLLPALKLDGWPKVSKACLRPLTKDAQDAIKAGGFHVIPKQCKDAVYQQKRHLLWRLSFSTAEKYLTKHADRILRHPTGSCSSSCRKLVMRMLKRMLEIFKETNNSPRCKEPNHSMVMLKKATQELRKEMLPNFEVSRFTTFQIRTLMWAEYYIEKPSCDMWTHRERRGRLQEAIMHVKDMLAGTKHVEHFFVPDYDIMKGVPRAERSFLYTLFYIAEKLF
nr:hypothetical protein BaRGS_015473 [Batillaria attramentaria]